MYSHPAVTFYITGLIISFLVSIYFSIVKIVFTSLDRTTQASEDEHLRFYTSRIEQILKKRALLSGNVSFGKTLANTSFAILSFGYLGYLFPDLPQVERFLISLLFSVVILELFAHQIPRAFALRWYRSYLPFSYYSYRLLSWLFLPFVSSFTSIHRFALQVLNYDEKLSFLTDREKAKMTSVDTTEGLNKEEREMIRSIFDLSDTTVDEIMVPRIDIKGLDVNSEMQAVLKIIREEGHSRIPVYRESIDHIIGVLYAKDIISWLSENNIESWNMSNMIKKPHFVPIGKKVNTLMREFKIKHIHLAIVVDEYGGTAGMVTMEDILEEIVGDIQDEYDVEEKEIVKISPNTYIVDPHIDLHDLSEELEINLELEDIDYNTLGGLVYHEYGDIPQEDVQFDYNGLRITVLKMDNQRIEKLKIETLQKPSTEQEEF
ncbi:Magnesium and cobalt efflux protein CorC [Chitinispirillum alkaliphilum]|nr:Magnesium and cobalt efflux protein CorC [Chitinispirillum alkaliphilum]